MYSSVNGKKVDCTINFKPADSYNYVIELVDTSSGDLATAFYVETGKPLAMVVPAGTYEVRYAVGNAWQGTDGLFGKQTQFFKAKSTINHQRKE